MGPLVQEATPSLEKLTPQGPAPKEKGHGVSLGVGVHSEKWVQTPGPKGKDTPWFFLGIIIGSLPITRIPA